MNKIKFKKFKLKEGDILNVRLFYDMVFYNPRLFKCKMMVVGFKQNKSYTFNGKPQNVVSLYDIENNLKYEIDIALQYVNNKSHYRFYLNGNNDTYVDGEILSNKI